MNNTSIELSNQSCFDFLKSLPNNSVDLFLIDPPYEVSRDTNFQSGELKGDNTDRFRVSMDFGDWDSGFTGLDTVISEAYRVLRKGGTLICFYDLWKLTTLKEYFEKAKFKQLRFIEWLKTNPVPLNSKTNYLTNAREIAILGVKGGRPTFHSEYDNGIYKYPICHDKGRFHPTQKPLALIEELIKKHSEEGDVVVDCFSGSGTTAHAVMKLNAEDGGHRKFIMIQLPENLNEAASRPGLDARLKANILTTMKYLEEHGYEPTICSIAEERIRRAGDKIKSESPVTTQDIDIGFRVLKLDDTNMKDVYYAPDDYDQGMLAGLESNIKDDRTDLDLLFGCLIDWGLPLSLPYSSEQIDGCTVHTYNGGDLIACFDANIPESVVKEIAKRKPLRAVFRDSGFASSPEKINVFEIFKLYMPEDANDITKRVRVI